jgi:hypothetical protein
MKTTTIIITIFLFTVSCSRNVDSSNVCYLEKLNIRSDFAGINTQKDYYATYDEQNRMKEVLYHQIGYGETLIVNYTIDYECKGLPSKVYRQNLKSFSGIDSVPRISIEFEYEYDTLKNVISDMGILGDIKYQGGNLKSIAYHYFGYNAPESKYIDTTKTRKFKLETNSSGNITRVQERKQYKIQYNDVIMNYDSMPNPYYLNLLSFIPEPDFIAFFSKNNWIQMITNDDSCKVLQSRAFTYNEHKYPTNIKTKHEFDFSTIESITYR